MSTTRKLSMNFLKSNGNVMNISYSHVKSDPSSSNVRLLMEGIIANGAIFKNTPAEMKSAKLITTDTQDIDLS